MAERILYGVASAFVGGTWRLEHRIADLSLCYQQPSRAAKLKVLPRLRSRFENKLQRRPLSSQLALL